MTEQFFSITGIDHIQLAAPYGCETAARQFYGDLLAFPEVPKPAALAKHGGVWFQVGSQALHIGVEELYSPARKAHPAFFVRNLDALAEQLERAGSVVQWDTDLPGYRRFYTADPWGNRLEFLTSEG